uniref:Uncharacterized protein n=1 Tax=Oryza nivara TaxID=4536 RepID=A0A0E0HI33_ORYNI
MVAGIARRVSRGAGTTSKLQSSNIAYAARVVVAPARNEAAAAAGRRSTLGTGPLCKNTIDVPRPRVFFLDQLPAGRTVDAVQPASGGGGVFYLIVVAAVNRSPDERDARDTRAPGGLELH